MRPTSAPKTVDQKPISTMRASTASVTSPPSPRDDSRSETSATTIVMLFGVPIGCSASETHSSDAGDVPASAKVTPATTAHRIVAFIGIHPFARNAPLWTTDGVNATRARAR